jgi:uncharacterized protein with NAD-binding domain and iron-sulfur cluster
MAPTAPRVAIFGGGVGGLSVAQELLERGLHVTVFEARHWGGKVRGIPIPNSGTQGRKDLPGQHGFHFFPSFYKNLPMTMQRIPVGSDGRSVFDHLVWNDFELLARATEPSAKIPARFRWSLDWFADSLVAFAEMKRGIPLWDLAFFAARGATFAGTCQARRESEFDEVTWWDFVGARGASAAYQRLAAWLPTSDLVAVAPEVASTRTLGNAMIQMLQSGFTPGQTIDRTLDGPEQETWVIPWVDHLRSLGAELLMPASLVELGFDGRRITGAFVEEDGRRRWIEADAYVCALPVDVAARLLGPDIRRGAPSLARIEQLCIGWMTGLQFFLRRALPVVRGHVGYDDSPWGVTSVSQAQLWPGYDWSQVGDGTAREAFSVILSDWETPGILFGKAAKHCTADEIRQETLAQINAALSKLGERIDDGDVVSWFLDPDITFPRGEAVVDRRADRNAEPLFVTTAGAWSARPGPATEIPNLFLASDWLRTSMDFASAEGTNEVSRQAANAILDAVGSSAPRAPVGKPDQPWIFAPLRCLDHVLYAFGLPALGTWGCTPWTPPPVIR